MCPEKDRSACLAIRMQKSRKKSGGGFQIRWITGRREDDGKNTCFQRNRDVLLRECAFLLRFVSF